MFSIISGILGFATSGLPSLLGFFQQKGDQAHEREMAKLQNEQAMRMAEKGFVSLICHKQENRLGLLGRYIVL